MLIAELWWQQLRVYIKLEYVYILLTTIVWDSSNFELNLFVLDSFLSHSRSLCIPPVICYNMQTSTLYQNISSMMYKFHFSWGERQYNKFPGLYIVKADPKVSMHACRKTACDGTILGSVPVVTLVIHYLSLLLEIQDPGIVGHLCHIHCNV